MIAPLLDPWGTQLADKLIGIRNEINDVGYVEQSQLLSWLSSSMYEKYQVDNLAVTGPWASTSIVVSIKFVRCIQSGVITATFFSHTGATVQFIGDTGDGSPGSIAMDLTTTGLPASFYPVTENVFPLVIMDNDVGILGSMYISVDGDIRVRRGAEFTLSGTGYCGFGLPTVSYIGQGFV